METIKRTFNVPAFENLTSKFEYLTRSIYDSIVLYDKHKTLKGLLSSFEKENNKIKSYHEAPELLRFQINVDWHKNYCGEWCASASGLFEYVGGEIKRAKTYASGYGYDKLAAVVTNLMNGCIKSVLYQKTDLLKSLNSCALFFSDYGNHFVDCGVECFLEIAVALGFEQKHFATKNSDIIIWERKN